MDIIALLQVSAEEVARLHAQVEEEIRTGVVEGHQLMDADLWNMLNRDERIACLDFYEGLQAMDKATDFIRFVLGHVNIDALTSDIEMLRGVFVIETVEIVDTSDSPICQAYTPAHTGYIGPDRQLL